MKDLTIPRGQALKTAAYKLLCCFVFFRKSTKCHWTVLALLHFSGTQGFNKIMRVDVYVHFTRSWAIVDRFFDSSIQTNLEFHRTGTDFENYMYEKMIFLVVLLQSVWVSSCASECHIQLVSSYIMYLNACFS